MDWLIYRKLAASGHTSPGMNVRSCDSTTVHLHVTSPEERQVLASVLTCSLENLP